MAEDKKIIGEWEEVKTTGLLPEHDYTHIRRVERDGNCFYYSFISEFLEIVKHNESEESRIKSLFEETNKVFAKTNKKEINNEFYETFMENIKMEPSQIQNIDLLGMVTYLKIIIATEIVTSDFYDPFLYEEESKEKFCFKSVNPLYVDADHLVIQALSNALKVGVIIISIDRGECTRVDVNVDKNYKPVCVLRDALHFEPIKLKY